jgi:NADH-quinone oxidoreductase subunit M
MPWFAVFAVFFLMANSGLPGTSGFVGEFMVILSAFQANFWFAFIAAFTVILGAAYSLWLVKRVIFGAVTNRKVQNLQDINSREALVLGTLAVAILFIGLWPQPLVDMMQVSVDHLLQHIVQSKVI